MLTTTCGVFLQQLLRHDSVLQPTKVRSHLAQVPDYLLPSGMHNGSNKAARKAKCKAKAQTVRALLRL